jgi:uncharacterized protein (DUF2235 family)
MMTAIGKLERAAAGAGGAGRAARSASKRQDDVGALFRLPEQFRATFSAPCRPYFVGVWDTVSSVGWIENPLTLPYSANNPDIQTGRHAISLDERRAFFRPNLWRVPSAPALGGPRDLKQVWFPGVHCDVGGGYPESESGLSKVALEWMLREAGAAGLLLDPAAVDLVLGRAGGDYAPPDALARRHESLKGWWRVAEYAPKRVYNWATGKREWHLNLGRRRTIPDHALIHDSAYRRGEKYLRTLRLPATAVRVR